MNQNEIKNKIDVMLNDAIVARARKINSTFSLEQADDITSIVSTDMLDQLHFNEWLTNNGYEVRKHQNDPYLYKKYKIDTLMKPEDGGFKFKHNKAEDYFLDDIVEQFQHEIDQEVLNECIKIANKK